MDKKTRLLELQHRVMAWFPRHFFFVSLVALRVYGFLQHEVWRSEAQLPLMVRDSHSFGQLLHWQSYGREHVLWPSLLDGLKVMGLDPVTAGQWLHLVLSVLLLGIIFYGIPRLPLIIRVLAGSSYFLMYEYTAIARVYGATALLLGIFVILEMRTQRRIMWKALTISLLALSSSVGLVLAIALASYLFVKYTGERLRTKAIVAGIIVLGITLSIVTALPPPDLQEAPFNMQYRDSAFAHWGIPRLLETSSHILLDGFLYIPRVTSQQWAEPASELAREQSLLSSTGLGHGVATYLIGLMVIVLAIWALWKLFRISKPIALATAILWGGNLLVWSAMNPGYPRHLGFIVLGTVALFALAIFTKTGFSVKWMISIIVAVLVIQSASGFWAVYAEGRDDFSQSKDLARWFRANYPQETPYVYPDHVGATLSFYTGDLVYSLQSGNLISFARETKENQQQPFQIDMIRNLASEGGNHILITQFPFHAILDEGKTVVEPVESFQPSVVPHESFWVHRIISGNQSEPWTLKLLPFEGQFWTLESSPHKRSEEFVSLPEPDLDNETGSTIEIRLKFSDAAKSDPRAFVLQLVDGERPLIVSFLENEFRVHYDDLRTRYEIDTTDAFHVYRFTIKGNNVESYVDGKKLGSSYITAAADYKQVVLGNMEETPGLPGSKGVCEHITAQIEYMAYYTNGALPPEGAQDSGKTGIWTTFDDPSSGLLSPYVWKQDGTLAARSVTAGVLAMSTKGGDFGYFSRPVPEFNNTTGSTSEVRIKLLEGPRNDPDGALFSLADGRREGRVSFFANRIVILDQNKAKAVRWMNTTDDFHTYRIAIIGDTLRFFVDGNEVASMALYGSSSDKRILFGDLSNREGENLSAKIDYVAHWIEGALTTEGVAIEPLAKGGEKTGEWTEARWGLTIDTTGTGTDPAGTGYLIEGFDNNKGSTAEVKMSISEAPASGSDGAMFSLIDGKREGKISFYADHINIRDQNEIKAVHWMDTTDDFHTYRIAIVGDTLKLFVDGDKVASVTLSGSSSDKKILFGDLSASDAENLNAQVEYLAYSIEGAMEPHGESVKPVWQEKTEEWTAIREGFTLNTTEKETDPTGTRYPIEEFDNAKGSTAEVKMRISGAPVSGSDGAMFSLIDGKREGKISFYADHINIRDQNEIKAVHWMDTTNDFHTYRVASLKDTLRVFVDGNQVASTTLSGPGSDKEILFGDLSTSEGENLNAQVEYLAYSVEGAIGPQGKPIDLLPQKDKSAWTSVRWGFTIDTAGPGTDPAGTGYPIEEFDNNKGSTAEVKMRISEAPASGSDGAMFSLIDGTREGKISFYTDYINIRDQNEVKAVHWMDTTDDFHTYIITLIKDTLRVFVDGNQVASTTLSGSSSDKKILFGDLSTSDGENLNARVEYLAYSVEGAITPDEH